MTYRRAGTAFALAMILAFPLALAACGGGGGGGGDGGKPQPTPEARADSDAIKRSLFRIIGRRDAGAVVAPGRGAEIAKDGILIDGTSEQGAGAIYTQTGGYSYGNYTGYGGYDVGGRYEAQPARWDIAIARALSEPRYNRSTYIGYMDESYFVTNTADQGSFGVSVTSVGDVNTSSPLDDAEWRGVMFGAYNENAEGRNDIGNILTGDARITFKVNRVAETTGLVDVSFSNIVDTVSGAKHDPLNWREIPFMDGRLARFDSLGDDRLVGRFYGSEHKEVGGVFYSRDHMEGSFGARRQ